MGQYGNYNGCASQGYGYPPSFGQGGCYSPGGQGNYPGYGGGNNYGGGQMQQQMMMMQMMQMMQQMMMMQQMQQMGGGGCFPGGGNPININMGGQQCPMFPRY